LSVPIFLEAPTNVSKFPQLTVEVDVDLFHMGWILQHMIINTRWRGFMTKHTSLKAMCHSYEEGCFTA
jgi:hypothetical protein